ncbi:DUF551 domain-containing protein [Klebsiella quasipneumoniae]|uniref:DUF551 domain-containing protein n=1 Tax=Klebsiella quasipneumoniae TaxID=1463165 RepID=UPI00388DE6DB
MKDHEIRELVNQLRDVAIKYHGAGQLREQIARTVRAAILQAGTLIGEGTKLPPLKCLEIVKFNADCALSDPESIYASEFFLSLDEAFGEKGNYIEPVQAKAVSMLIGEVLRLHNYQTGSSPVIQEGYVMVPKEATLEMIKSGTSAASNGMLIPGIYKAMLAAADCSIPMISDRWIPVSEQMPPSRHEVLVGRWWGEKPRWCCKWATYIPGHPDAQSSGWLLPGASWTPTHWMPLPAAPQEVINVLIPLASRNEREVK